MISDLQKLESVCSTKTIQTQTELTFISMKPTDQCIPISAIPVADQSDLAKEMSVIKAETRPPFGAKIFENPNGVPLTRTEDVARNAERITSLLTAPTAPHGPPIHHPLIGPPISVPNSFMNYTYRPQQMTAPDPGAPATYQNPAFNHLVITEPQPQQLKLPIASDVSREDPLAFLRASRPRPGIPRVRNKVVTNIVKKFRSNVAKNIDSQRFVVTL